MALNQGQQKAFDAFKKGKNLFITGDAGTGKSFLLRQISESATAEGKNVLIVAPTGKAAQNVNGATIHSTFLANVGIIDPEEIFQGRSTSVGNQSVNILEICDILICDEVSMVRYDLYEGMIRSIKNAEKKSHKHIQLIFVGDFYQLPPILNIKKDGGPYSELYQNKLFAFESDFFRSLQKFRLTEKMRTGDAEFAHILDQLRIGDFSVLSVFEDERYYTASENAIILCARNTQADAINAKKMSELSGQITYEATSTRKIDKDEKFAPDKLTLAPGAHILFTVNDTDKRWINGTDGIVSECHDTYIVVAISEQTVTVHPVTKKIMRPELVETMVNGKKKKQLQNVEVGSYSQFPLKPGWAISIHKSQGMTLQEVNINPNGCFSHGQLYVAISRCTSLKGIHFQSKPLPEHLICDPKVKEFMDNLNNADTFKVKEQRSTDNPADNKKINDSNDCAALGSVEEQTNGFKSFFQRLVHSIKSIFARKESSPHKIEAPTKSENKATTVSPSLSRVQELEAEIARLNVEKENAVKAAAHDALTTHFEEIKNKRGPKPKNQNKFLLRLDSDLYIIIKDIVSNEGSSLNVLINHYVRNGIANEHPQYFE